jgi:uncharacterized small protein (DUF1192 family)
MFQQELTTYDLGLKIQEMNIQLLNDISELKYNIVNLKKEIKTLKNKLKRKRNKK